MNQKLEQIKAALRHAIELSEAATPGPWDVPRGPETNVVSHADTLCVSKCGESPRPVAADIDNAAFIAHARTFAPAAAKALLADIEWMEHGLGSLWTAEVHWFCQSRIDAICREWPEDS